MAAVLCIGEALWDALPEGLFLGGAPLNVAAHLAALGVPVALASAVGEDALGEEARQRIAQRGIPTDLLHTDPERPTGLSRITLDARGDATFEVVEPAAWDAIPWTDALAACAAGAPAVVFGTLAQRHPTSRETIQKACAAGGLRVLDVNLRPPYDALEVVEPSLHLADFAKLSAEELSRLAGPSGTEEARARALAKRYGLRGVCVTRGAGGAALLHRGRWREVPGEPVQVVDTVGAGDAFLAALLAALLGGAPDDVALARANRLGAFVASQPGAVPAYDPRVVLGG